MARNEIRIPLPSAHDRDALIERVQRWRYAFAPASKMISVILGWHTHILTETQIITPELAGKNLGRIEMNLRKRVWLAALDQDVYPVGPVEITQEYVAYRIPGHAPVPVSKDEAHFIRVTATLRARDPWT